jgi:hypothetical protein
MYGSHATLIGLAVVAFVAVLILNPGTRKAGWIGAVALLLIGVIGMRMHHG